MRSKTTTRSRTSSERAAELAGATLNRIGRTLPGILGPLLVAVGLWLAWPPLGVMALGLILWSMDRWMP